MDNFISSLKKTRVLYYLINMLDYALVPLAFYRKQKRTYLKKANKYSQEIINSRVNYYISNNKEVNIEGVELKKFKKTKRYSMYYFDVRDISKYFKGFLKIKYLFGDIDKNVDSLTIVKSRPINHNGNSVILRLDTFRHYNFIKDKRSFTEKKSKIVWRGVIHKENRRTLVEGYFDNEHCDIGEFSKNKNQWSKDFLSIDDQLNNRYILSIEGNDVATNLKWIMSSNSLCFMPKPKFETWYMEGKLIPNHHYVLIKDDYSDMIEKMEFYDNNQDKALKIIKNANEWTEQFKDETLEKIISIKVLQKYFENTNQL